MDNKHTHAVVQVCERKKKKRKKKVRRNERKKTKIPFVLVAAPFTMMSNEQHIIPVCALFI